MLPAMILAAGLGTRLRPLTLLLPKPLLPVGDRPAIAHIAAQLARAPEIREAALNTHHLAEAFTAEILDALPLRVRVIHEPGILGTAGGVANARALLGEGDVLVWNGDILAEIDVRALAEQHRRERALATLVMAPRAAGQGTVGLGEGGRVVRLRGERFGEEIAGGDFLGVHVLSAAVRDQLPASGCLAGDVYLPMLRRGARLETFAYTGAWDDIGTIEAYLDANARWLARTGRDAHVDASARVDAGVQVEASVIGAGATVSGSGCVRRCVLWPGAHMEAPLDDAVVTPHGVVRGRPH